MKVWERLKALWSRGEWTVQQWTYGRPGNDDQFHEWNEANAWILPPDLKGVTIPQTTIDKETGTILYLCDRCYDYCHPKDDDMQEIGNVMVCRMCRKGREDD